MTDSINFNNAEFVKSAAAENQFIISSLPKIVFSGKSNVGKSSVINRILNRKNFARVGSEPGKTVHVNYFVIDKKIMLVDLPGYGYAKVSTSEKNRWAQLMERFFAAQDTFNVGALIVDARHKPTEDDVLMADWFSSSGRDFFDIANKIDKVKKSEIEGNIKLIRTTLKIDESIQVLPFSAEKGTGREQLLGLINKYL